MDIAQAIKELTRIQTLAGHGSDATLSMVVKVFNPGSIGGTPCELVTGMYAGIDWNKGRVLLSTETPLTRLTPEDVAAVHKSAKEGQSWHAFQQYKKQDAKIKALEAEVASLKGQLKALGDQGSAR